jgi:hypothetical protein
VLTSENDVLAKRAKASATGTLLKTSETREEPEKSHMGQREGREGGREGEGRKSTELSAWDCASTSACRL